MKIILGVIITLVFTLILACGCTETIDNNQITTIEKTPVPKPSVSEEGLEQNIESEDLVHLAT